MRPRVIIDHCQWQLHSGNSTPVGGLGGCEVFIYANNRTIYTYVNKLCQDINVRMPNSSSKESKTMSMPSGLKALQKGVPFRMSCKVDMKERNMAIAINGLSCGVAFENIPPVIIPAVSLYGPIRVKLKTIQI